MSTEAITACFTWPPSAGQRMVNPGMDLNIPMSSMNWVRHALPVSAEKTRVYADEPDFHAGVTDEAAHLFTGAHGQKTRVGAEIGAQSGAREAGGHRYAVLFGYACFYETLWPALEKGFALDRFQRIRGDKNYIGALFGEGDEPVPEANPRADNFGAHFPPPNSCIA